MEGKITDHLYGLWAYYLSSVAEERRAKSLWDVSSSPAEPPSSPAASLLGIYWKLVGLFSVFCADSLYICSCRVLLIHSRSLMVRTTSVFRLQSFVAMTNAQ